MPSSAVMWAVGPVLQIQPPRHEAVGAVLLVCVSTLIGAFLARRNARRMSLWLAIASAMILVTALVDLLPDAWGEAVEAGVPLWTLGASAGFGFLVITYFTRRGCACPDDEPPPAAMHAPGLHRRVRQGVNAAVFGGMGTAAALTLHRAIEGAALALTASVVVIVALVVHSASEGLALAVLLDIAKQRLAPWLVVACLSPAVGVVTATISPLPEGLVPILLSMVMGVLCRTAIVGMKLAASKQQSGRLSRRQIAIAATVATGAGILLATAHTLGGDEGGAEEAARHAGAAVPATGATALTDSAALTALTTAAALPSPVPAPPAPRPAGAAAPPARTDSPARTPPSAPRSRPDRLAMTTPLSRAGLREAVRSGRLGLGEVFRRTDETTLRTPIGRILRALPGSSRDTARALMASGGVGPRQPVADLNERQRRDLLTAARTLGPAAQDAGDGRAVPPPSETGGPD
ncbi:hypothetical protein [Microbispora sp. NPDC049125]|uniref:hypothetical protein n=1 Tax=Microbispora sp. NPDC049125 TaxID=3154929 RepID=UPI003466737D